MFMQSFPVSASSVGNLICKARVTNINGLKDKSYLASEYWLYELVQFEPKFIVRECSVNNLQLRCRGMRDIEIEYPYTMDWADITQHIKEYGLDKTYDLIKEIKHNAGCEDEGNCLKSIYGLKSIYDFTPKILIWNNLPVIHSDDHLHS